jgi:hypothetical protein
MQASYRYYPLPFGLGAYFIKNKALSFSILHIANAQQ